MKLSHSSVSKIADALKPAIIEYLFPLDNLTKAIPDRFAARIPNIMGDMDDELFFPIGMLVFDRIDLK